MKIRKGYWAGKGDRLRCWPVWFRVNQVLKEDGTVQGYGVCNCGLPDYQIKASELKTCLWIGEEVEIRIK